MHIEDDVTTASGFMAEIKTFVSKMEQSRETWFLLEFSTLGFIGKLFRSNDLCSMKDYFLLFKDEKPCDLLINNLQNIKTQVKKFKSPKSLFQHFGLASSLKGKIQKLTDKNFKDKPKNAKDVGHIPSLKQSVKSEKTELLTYYKSIKVPNPEAKVHTSMEIYESFSAERPYIVGMTGFFWAKAPNTSDFYRIVFVKPINITEIQIKTGHPKQNIDRLENAVLKVGYFSEENCKNSMILGGFKDGQFTAFLNKPILDITCIEIYVVKPQTTWMIIYEIIIRTAERNQNNKEVVDVKRIV